MANRHRRRTEQKKPRVSRRMAKRIKDGQVPRGIVRHEPFGAILQTIIRNGREHQFHATKGWRSRRA